MDEVEELLMPYLDTYEWVDAGGTERGGQRLLCEDPEELRAGIDNLLEQYQLQILAALPKEREYTSEELDPKTVDIGVHCNYYGKSGYNKALEDVVKAIENIIPPTKHPKDGRGD